METGQQEHRNKHKCRNGQRKVDCFRYDISKSTVVCHDRLLEAVGNASDSAHMGLGGGICEDTIKIYFPAPSLLASVMQTIGEFCYPPEDRASE
jgi:hypothetical protein